MIGLATLRMLTPDLRSKTKSAGNAKPILPASFQSTMIVPVELRPKAETDKPIVTRVYAIADLVVPMPVHSSPFEELIKAYARGGLPAATRNSGQNTAKAQKPELAEQLVNLITNNIAAQTWQSVGGPGTISFYPVGNALIVNQTAEVHDEIASLLANLRKLNDVQIAVGLFVLTVSDDVLDSVNLKNNLEYQPLDGDPSKGICFLNDLQCKEFLEAVRADERTESLANPKIVVSTALLPIFQSLDTSSSTRASHRCRSTARRISWRRTLRSPSASRCSSLRSPRPITARCACN